MVPWPARTTGAIGSPDLPEQPSASTTTTGTRANNSLRMAYLLEDPVLCPKRNKKRRPREASAGPGGSVALLRQFVSGLPPSRLRGARARGRLGAGSGAMPVAVDSGERAVVRAAFVRGLGAAAGAGDAG